MADVGRAGRIRPGADGWRALPPQTRVAVWRAARRREPAGDVATAVAAVGYGRYLRRRWYLIAAGLGVVTLALLPVAGAGRAVDAVLVIAGLAGCGALAALARGGRGPRWLIGANLGLAAGHAPGAVRPEWRAGPQRSRQLFTVMLIAWPVGAVALLVWQQTCPGIVASIAFVAAVVRGPSWSGMARTVAMSADGVDLPTWRARIPWTSVSVVDVGADGSELRVSIDGPFEVTGSLPGAWARRVAVALQPGKTVKLLVAWPEVGLRTARHYLAATPRSGR